MSEWQQVRKQSTRRGDPQLSIYTNGDAHLNVRAVEEYFDDVDAVLLHYDPAGQRLAFEPVHDAVDAYSLTKADSGADIRLQTALTELGIDVDAIDETQFIPLLQEGELIVADLSDLPAVDGQDDDAPAKAGGATDDEVAAAVDDEGDTDDDDDLDVDAVVEDLQNDNDPVAEKVQTNGHAEDTAEDDADDSEDVQDDAGDEAEADDPLMDQLLGILSRLGHTDEFTAGGLANELDADGRAVGAKLRKLRNDDDAIPIEQVGEDEDSGTAVYSIGRQRDRDQDGDDEDDDRDVPSREDVRHISGSVVTEGAKTVASVQELANFLEVSEGRARNLAQQYDVYDELRDQVDRPGVDRNA